MHRSSIQLTFSQMLEDFSMIYNVKVADGEQSSLFKSIELLEGERVIEYAPTSQKSAF